MGCNQQLHAVNIKVSGTHHGCQQAAFCASLPSLSLSLTKIGCVCVLASSGLPRHSQDIQRLRGNEKYSRVALRNREELKEGKERVECERVAESRF